MRAPQWLPHDRHWGLPAHPGLTHSQRGQQFLTTYTTWPARPAADVLVRRVRLRGRHGTCVRPGAAADVVCCIPAKSASQAGAKARDWLSHYILPDPTEARDDPVAERETLGDTLVALLEGSRRDRAAALRKVACLLTDFDAQEK